MKKMQRPRHSIKKTAVTSAMTLVTLSAVVCQHAVAATDALDIDVEIVTTNLAISAVQNLNFGTIIQGGTGNARIDPDGGTNYGGTLSVVTNGVPGVIRTYGNMGMSVDLTVPPGAVTVSNGTTTMAVSQFNIETNAGGSAATVNLGAATIDVPVGATLVIPAGKPAGSYSGSVTINASYH